MNKRDKKLNLKLNRLNEEDENTAEGDAAEELKSEALEQRNQEIISQEYEFLKNKINKVFKLIPYCEPNLMHVMDSDEKRLEFLYHSLLERFCSDTEDKTLDLASHDLNDECLKHFSLSKLISLLNLTEAESFSSQELFNLNQNLKQTNFLLLNSNSFKQIPYSLIDLFDNCSLIDLSNNSIDSISLVHLSKFEGLRELNLCGNSLKSFGDPTTVNLADSIFSSIERLNLSGNQLTSDTSLLISQFKNLKYLNLSDNNYLIDEQSQLPWQQMSCILSTNLIELDMSKNNKLLDQVTSSVVKSIKAGQRADSAFSTASSANLSYISSKPVVKSFNCLTNLKVLNLSENNLVNVPSDIKDLKLLEELVLDRNQIEFVPDELIALKHLRCLSLSGNKLNELSDTFCQYAKFRQSLIKLDLSSNNLKCDKLSLKICLFENLDNLNLADNAFDLIPNALPKNLHHLDISNNRIKYLMIRPLAASAQQDDDILRALDYTEHTSLNKIQKTKLKFDMNYDRPETDSAEELLLPHVFYLRNLKSLNVARNRLVEVPTDFGLLNSNLEYLNMSSNFLTQINTALCRGLGNLKHLDVSDNKLRLITDKIRELTSLENLNLSHNRLTSLNYELCVELKSLKQLDLSHNYLEQLPLFTTNQPKASSVSFSSKKFTFNLTNLEKIDLSSNRLKSKFCVYTAVAHCANLVELNLSCNSISCVDMDAEKSELGVDELVDEQKAKKLAMPKLCLMHMRSLNLSDNQVLFEQGGFVKLLNSVYKLAPNLTEIHYAQSNGLKLGLIDSDKNFCFMNQDLDTQALDKLKVIDLSANALTHFPSFVLQTKNLTEIYFNNNFLKRIPNEFFKETFSLEDYDQNFKKLEIKAKKKVRDLDSDDEENEDDDEDDESRKKRRKKKLKKQPSAREDPLDEQIKLVDQRAQMVRDKNYLSERLEILHLNANLIESIPQNFFSYFKCLREIKLNDNPLKDPPQQSICLSAPTKLNRNQVTARFKAQEHEQNTLPQHFEITSLHDHLHSRPKTSSYHFDKFQQSKAQIQFPNLSSTQDLRPLQSYMLKYKSREGNHFYLIFS